MDFQEFKSHVIREKLGIDTDKFGKVFSFIDFGNVNHWFDNDTRGWDGNFLNKGDEIDIDLEKLFSFTNKFSDQIRFYYGHDPQNKKSLKFLGKTKHVFGKRMVFTKVVQKIRHYLKDTERSSTTRAINNDAEGDFIILPKCNFDVEICVDAIRLINKYDTFCLFSSDADFVSLVKFLKNNRKKVILIKGGYIQYPLKSICDLVINAQDIKRYIVYTKQKSSPRD